MKALRHLPFLVFFVLSGPAAFGQSYDALRASYPSALETTVKSAAAYVYSEPDLSAQVVGRYSQGKAVLAYNKLGDFYAVATTERGHVGYMLLTDLDVPQEPGAAVATRVSTNYRDPRTARTMSFALPGGGHLYTGDMGRGTLLLAVGIGGFMGGYALSQNTREVVCSDTSFECSETVDYTYLAIGSGVALAAWVVGILDAPRSARRMNAQRGLSASLAPAPLPLAGAPRLGLAMRVRW